MIFGKMRAGLEYDRRFGLVGRKPVYRKLMRSSCYKNFAQEAIQSQPERSLCLRQTQVKHDAYPSRPKIVFLWIAHRSHFQTCLILLTYLLRPCSFCGTSLHSQYQISTKTIIKLKCLKISIQLPKRSDYAQINGSFEDFYHTELDFELRCSLYVVAKWLHLRL